MRNTLKIFWCLAILLAPLALTGPVQAQTPPAGAATQQPQQQETAPPPQAGVPSTDSTEWMERRQGIREEHQKIRAERDRLQAERDSLKTQCLDSAGQARSECHEKMQAIHDQEQGLHERMKALHEKMEAMRKERHEGNGPERAHENHVEGGEQQHTSVAPPAPATPPAGH